LNIESPRKTSVCGINAIVTSLMWFVVCVALKDIFLALCHTLLDIKTVILLVNGRRCRIPKSAGLSMRVVHYVMLIFTGCCQCSIKRHYTTTERHSLAANICIVSCAICRNWFNIKTIKNNHIKSIIITIGCEKVSKVGHKDGQTAERYNMAAINNNEE